MRPATTGWHKRGLVVAPDPALPWSQQHCIAPTPLVRSPDELRVFYASTDADLLGRVAWVDLDAADPRRVLRRADRPVLDVGEPGTFDDCGVNATSVLEHEGRLLLYYFGYQRSQRVPYLLLGGVAISEDGGETFHRHMTTPLLERRPREETLRSAPVVLRRDDGFHMWYVAGSDWVRLDGGKLLPRYGIRHMRSDDPLRWDGPSTDCIAPADEDEIGFGRPWVVRDGDRLRMWYSLRRRVRPDLVTYVGIGQAVSADGVTWERRDEPLALEPSADGWDSGMVCYAAVVRSPAGGRWLMFHNGDRHGATGFGVAESEALG
jgi:hypothetical protein